LSKLGHNFPAAIREIIDNSVDSIFDKYGNQIFDNVKIYVNWSPNEIRIIDNGKGMNETELKNCMTISSSDKQNQIGNFGVGLKSAPFFIGRKISIITTTNDSNYTYRLDFDIDKYRKINKWILPSDWIKIYKKKEEDLKHGTVVRISNLISSIPSRLKSDLLDSCGLYFNRFIDKKLIDINIDGERCLYYQHPIKKTSKRSFMINVKKGITLSGWLAIKEEDRTERKSGFYLYKNDKLITTHSYFGIHKTRHTSLNWLTGEIDLNFADTQPTKLDFAPTPLFLLSEKKAKEQIKPLIQELLKIYQIDKYQEKETYSKKVSSYIKKTSDLYDPPNIDDKKDNLYKKKNKIKKEIRMPGDSHGTIIPVGTGKKRTPKKYKMFPYVHIKGKRVNVKFKTIADANTTNQYNYSLTDTELVITYNIKFPMYSHFDRELYEILLYTFVELEIHQDKNKWDFDTVLKYMKNSFYKGFAGGSRAFKS